MARFRWQVAGLVLSPVLLVAAVLLPGGPAAAQFGWSHVTSWGSNYYGQLGDGSTQEVHATPVLAGRTDLQFTDVALGGSHAVAKAADGTVWAWGFNTSGQLGDGGVVNRSNTPVRVVGLTNVVAVYAGGAFSMAKRSDGSVWAWGSNVAGQLGIGGGPNRFAPVQVPALTGVLKISLGGRHGLALLGNGHLSSWGDNANGQLGTGNTVPRATPGAVVSLVGVVDLAAGDTHSLAATNTGQVRAWGRNDRGQLGNGTTTPATVPALVPGLTGVGSVATGWSYSLALSGTGQVWAWGDNDRGQLGIGSSNGYRATPDRVRGLTNIVGIASGQYFGLARSGAGQNSNVWGWGGNDFGQLGLGVLGDRDLPVPIPALAGSLKVTSGPQSSFAAAIRTIPIPPPAPTPTPSEPPGTPTLGPQDPLPTVSPGTPTSSPQGPLPTGPTNPQPTIPGPQFPLPTIPGTPTLGPQDPIPGTPTLGPQDPTPTVSGTPTLGPQDPTPTVSGTPTLGPPQPVAEFELAVGETAGALPVGGTIGVPLAVTGEDGFMDTVVFGVGPLPSGVSAAFAPKAVIGGGKAVLTLTASPESKPGRFAFAVTITGKANGTDLTRTVSYQLTLTDPIG
ncbi:hypothetical protein Acor_08400 [Acrocarpospora corrugata]|uniref:RCC1-like domain-containing protein n=1 Tax=Acrocarpospora corrugata TaxID=35763 RepID=A0A5M3VPR5_9ACTN|nr:RCC1 domain-containing protein [Acrocarpospora corrugata]GER98776.1 hypothetical protein Acor_08400 [Acrocarpospora corrugata]